MARLLSAGVAQAAGLSALVYTFSPFATRHPSARATKTHVDAELAAREMDPYVGAAAQWILHGGDVLYEMCAKDVVFTYGQKKWTLALWENWKDKFAATADDERYGGPTRDLAKKALERMAKLERSGVIASGKIWKFNPDMTNETLTNGDVDEEENDDE